MTKKMVTLEGYDGPKRPGDPLVQQCIFEFSVVDRSLVDTPREGSAKSFHLLRVSIERPLAVNWGLVPPSPAFFSRPTAEQRDALLRVMFFRAMEYVQNSIRMATLREDDELHLIRRTEEVDCPFVIPKLPSPDDPDGRVFDVELDEEVSDALEACLQSFMCHIESERRMAFWEYSKPKRRYTWRSRPEQAAKELLCSYLKGRYREQLDTFEEIGAGAGRVDVYVVWPNRETAVIELKMCGHGYSMDYATSGVEQLVHYMRNKKTSTGFLLVFDSRMRDFGKGLDSDASFDGVEVRVLVADMRPYVKRRSAPPDV